MRIADLNAIFSSDLSCIEKMVLLSIAKHANAPGDCPFPSRERIAMLSSVNETTAGRAIAKLKTRGWLLARKRFGHSTVYTIQLVTPSLNEAVTKCTAPHQLVTPSPSVSDAVTSNHPSNHPIESIHITSDDLFAEFWEAYGNKKGRSITLKLWKKIPLKTRVKIMDALPAYVESTPELTYRKHPATWLRGQHWEDEIVPRNMTRTKAPLQSPPDEIAWDANPDIEFALKVQAEVRAQQAAKALAK